MSGLKFEDNKISFDGKVVGTYSSVNVYANGYNSPKGVVYSEEGKQFLLHLRKRTPNSWRNKQKNEMLPGTTRSKNDQEGQRNNTRIKMRGEFKRINTNT